MTEAEQIAQRYLATWNETDAQQRTALLREYWAEDASYVDPLGSAAGHAAIDDLIAGVQQRFPHFRFQLSGDPDGYAEHVRFSWSLGPAGSVAPIEGSDVLVIRSGRIARVIGFLDKLPG